MRLFTIHEQLGHPSFSTLSLMVKCGIISNDLATVDPPVYPRCTYDKAHRKQWRYKCFCNQRYIRQATVSSDVVSIDQLVSPTRGFDPIHRESPTKKRYIGATLFVDHSSEFTYCHLITELNDQSTINAKLTFGRLAATHNVSISHYYYYNGIFDTKLFKHAVSTAN